jgi:hypothetical protein
VNVTGGSTVSSISIGAHTPKKSYTVTIAGTSGSLVETTTVTVTVQ